MTGIADKVNSGINGLRGDWPLCAGQTSSSQGDWNGAFILPLWRVTL